MDISNYLSGIPILTQQIVGGCIALAIIIILIYVSFDFVKNKKR